MNHQVPAQGHLKPQGVRPSFALVAGEFVGGQRQAAEPIRPLGPLGGRLFGRPLGLGAVVAVNVTRGNQLLNGRLVFLGPLRLVIRAVGPPMSGPSSQSMPIHRNPIEDALDGVLDVPLLVGVIDPEQELPAGMAGQQPVEEGRPALRRYAGSRSDWEQTGCVRSLGLFMDYANSTTIKTILGLPLELYSRRSRSIQAASR